MNIQSVLVSDALNSVLFAMGYGEWPAVSSEVLRAISQSANRAVPAQRQGQVSLPVIGRQGMESLVQRARAFFERKTTLSYTLLEATEDPPYLFFKRYVLKMDTGNQATRMGERVHRRAEALFRGRGRQRT
ncbi:hypothetical protein [Thermogymnomonas acidicola]|uniref:hypothetical protein n=1 Tax=Thermogymnomonas acidicola TaxID=399579 RepID=UPI001396C085|nr:hypothetical protein [Thermogymnomonas acidicola]